MLRQYMKKKNTTCTVTFIYGVFSVQSAYIYNPKPDVTFRYSEVIGARSPAFAMNLEKINELTAQDMAGVNATILEQLNSDVQLINQLGYYIVSGGGKRIRPMIAVLAARAVGYQENAHVTIAALIEFIHTATLLHDDVVDESDMRRGKATANAAFGNAASVLVGDFIYTRAFQMMTSLGSLKVLEVMSKAVNVIAEGEVLQLMNVNDPDITEENYMRVIYSKTARLFEAAAQCSGILAGCSEEQEKGLQDYGRYLGTAFQLIDDLLDYNADGEQLGKNVGDDLNEGKPTLPLLHAMRHGTPEQAQMIRQAIEQGNGRHLLEPVLEAMNACGSLEWTRQRAEEEADKAIAALQVLPDTPWREALIGLAHIAVQRDR
ncbi:octaprenyl-diphosphate synthase [Citrobacter sp. KTE32]|nr:octaprenyl-diphosphate synthase [Citrobacter sp. KTE32]